mgnify:CR=1 FL=1
MLSQLVYVSKRAEHCQEQDIEQILESSVRNNQNADVTGVLLYSKDRFLQCIEGEYRTLNALYAKIKEDKRHYDATMIALTPVPSRAFPSWQMAGKSVNLDKVDFKNQMNASEQQEFEALLNGEKADGKRVAQLIERFFY